MSYPAEFLEEIRMRIPVSSVVGRKVRLKKRGNEFIGLSPFKAEKTPSFTVNDAKQFYHCFSTGEHGDIFAFVMANEGLSFPEAVEQLASEAGLDVPQRSEKERVRAKKHVSLLALLELATQYFTAALWRQEGSAALDSLRARGLNDATIQKFRLGYADPSGQGLYRALQKHHAKLDDLKEAGLFRTYQSNPEPVAFFRNRIIFPITDRRGRAIAFGGRYMGDARAYGVGKYINSPETPLFDKGRVLYNLEMARQASHKGAPILVAEGYMDVIALSQAGFLGAVAPLGTALTDAQLMALWRLDKQPILCFDGDAAGRKASFRAADCAVRNIKPGHSLRFIFLPEGADPDSFIQAHGADDFAKLLQDPTPLDRLIWQQVLQECHVQTPEQRADFEARLFAVVAQMPDPSVQKHYRKLFSSRLWQFFSNQTRPNRQARGPFRPYDRGGRGGAMARTPLPPWQQAAVPWGKKLSQHGDKLSRRKQAIFLACLINHPKLMDIFEEQLSREEFDPDLDKLRQQYQILWSSNPDLDVTTLTTHLVHAGLGNVLDGVLHKDIYQFAAQADPQSSDEDAATLLNDILRITSQDKALVEMQDFVARTHTNDSHADQNLAWIDSILEKTDQLDQDEE